MDIQIIGMTRVPIPKRNKANDIIVANFDAEVGPLRLVNCALVKIYNKGGEVYKGFAAWPPSVVTSHGRKGVKIMDHEFAKDLMVRAREVYLALGGEDESVLSD